MRDLETCKAEIFRRSENRIKERARQRRRALTLCVPLVLCLVVGAVVWPGISKDAGTSHHPNAMENGMAASPEKRDEAVQSPADSAILRIDDAAALALMESLAPVEEQDFVIGMDETNSMKNYGQPHPAEESAVEDGEETFVLVTPNGEQTYVLSDGVLICRSENWRRELTEEEEMNLRQTLGLPGNDSR
jgi:hypothetical protein